MIEKDFFEDVTYFQDLILNYSIDFNNIYSNIQV